MEASQVFQPRPYRRAWWLPGAHLQTIGGWLLRSAVGLRFDASDWKRRTPTSSISISRFAKPGNRASSSSRARPWCWWCMRAYAAGETGDLELAVQRIEQFFPGAPLAVLGYPLGGNCGPSTVINSSEIL